MNPEDYKEALDKAKFMVEDGAKIKEVRAYLKEQGVKASKSQVKQFMDFVKKK